MLQSIFSPANPDNPKLLLYLMCRYAKNINLEYGVVRAITKHGKSSILARIDMAWVRGEIKEN